MTYAPISAVQFFLNAFNPFKCTRKPSTSLGGLIMFSFFKTQNITYNQPIHIPPPSSGSPPVRFFVLCCYYIRKREREERLADRPAAREGRVAREETDWLQKPGEMRRLSREPATTNKHSPIHIAPAPVVGQAQREAFSLTNGFLDRAHRAAPRCGRRRGLFVCGYLC